MGAGPSAATPRVPLRQSGYTRRVTTEATTIGKHHPLLGEFRRAFRQGLLEQASGPPLLAIEGPRLIGEALRSGHGIAQVLFTPTGLEQHGAKLMPQFSKRTAVRVTEEAAFAAAMDSEHPQGVAALVQYAPAGLKQLFEPRPALVLTAAGLQDPGNLGTLLRAADAFGATGVVALTDTVSPFRPKAVRASAGSIFRMPVAAPVAAADLIAAVRERGIKLLATAAHGGDWDEAAALLAQPCCLLIGQEGSGLPRELIRAADATLAIPVARAVESLNAGMAGAVLLYEAMRQRQKIEVPGVR